MRGLCCGYMRAAVSGDAEQQQSLAPRRGDDDDADDDCSTAASCPSRCACSDTIVDCRDRGLTDIPSSRSLPADTTELLSLSLSSRPSVCLSVCLSHRAAALGYRHAGCLQLSHVWTADPSADGRRSAASRTAIGGGISSRRCPGRYLAISDRSAAIHYSMLYG